MAEEKYNIDESEINCFLASLGIMMPRNEAELNQVLNNDVDVTSELINYHIDASKIIKECGSFLNGKRSFKPIFPTKRANDHFKRIVLAAEITSQLYEEPSFGHVKFQKMIYLCENVIGLDFQLRYTKQAAGPYDAKFMHSIDQNFQKQGWFDVSREKSKFSKITYRPGSKFNTHKTYFYRYFKNDTENIKLVIDLFRTSKTRNVELIATLFYCWNELLEKKQLINVDSLKKAVYDWSEEKAKYNENEIFAAYNWMCDSNFHP